MRRMIQVTLCTALAAALSASAMAQETRSDGEFTQTITLSEAQPTGDAPGNWTFGSQIFYLKDPFVGSSQEGFEASTMPNYMCPPCFYNGCLPDLMFQKVGTVCANSAHITGGWSFRCQINRHGGTRMYGSTGSPTTLNFDKPARRFGSYMGTNAGEGPDAQMDFYSPEGNLIATKTAFFSQNCEWRWNGWVSNVPIGRIVITGNNPFGGGFVMLDDMEYDPFEGGGCDPCDVNCDGAVDAFDIEPFIDILVNMTPGCSSCAADTNEDGTVDAFDIEPFIECLVGP